MTPLRLQDDIVTDLKELFKEYVYVDSYGNNAPLNIFAQTIPYQDSEDDDDSFPYVEVRISEGEDDGETHNVTVIFVAGIRDSGKEAQGHRSIMNILQRIRGRYGAKPATGNGTGYQSGKWNWALETDSYYPYFFGAATTNFITASVQKEDRYA